MKLREASIIANGIPILGMILFLIVFTRFIYLSLKHLRRIGASLYFILFFGFTLIFTYESILSLLELSCT